ncbi:MAG: 50S ribosomal protein L3 [Proteobacteria bacterium]|nr:50S ribosomal protein L3 [Pseudomonadota bacterium]
MLGLIGKKVGMTQMFADGGENVPVTAIEVGPCTVVQRKLPEKEGYSALQLGFGRSRGKRMSRAEKGHFEKKGLPLFSHVREFRTGGASGFEVGDELIAAGFKPGDVVSVTGISKGRGFQGVMKRHGKHGGPASHGSDFHRRPGSIGMRTWPGRVPKNMKMPGHMGCERITIDGLEVVAVRPDDNVILVRGSVPGSRGGMLLVVPKDRSFETRQELKRGAAASPAAMTEDNAAAPEQAGEADAAENK